MYLLYYGLTSPSWAETNTDLIYVYINLDEAAKGESEKNKEKYAKNLGNLIGDIGEGTYDHLTENEKKTFNYLYNTGHKDDAEKYLEQLKPTLVMREGQARKEDAEDSFFARQGVMLSDAAAGIIRDISGAVNAVTGNEEIPEQTAGEIAAALTREDMGDFEGVVTDLGTNLVRNAPSMALSAIPGVGTYIGLGAMFVQSAGGAYTQGLQSGMTVNQARAYAVLNGASESGLQYVLGGISSLGGKAYKAVADEAVVAARNAFQAAAIKYGASMLSEATEEGLQSILDPYFKSLVTFGEQKADVDWNEVAYSALLGALSAGVMESPNVIYEVNYVKNTGKNALADSGIKDVVKNIKKAAEILPPDSRAAKLGKSINENSTPYQVGEALREIGNEIRQQNINAAAADFESRGLSPRVAERWAEISDKVFTGYRLSEGEIRELESNDSLREAFANAVTGENSPLLSKYEEFGEKRITKEEAEKATDEALGKYKDGAEIDISREWNPVNSASDNSLYDSTTRDMIADASRTFAEKAERRTVFPYSENAAENSVFNEPELKNKKISAAEMVANERNGYAPYSSKSIRATQEVIRDAAKRLGYDVVFDYDFKNSAIGAEVNGKTIYFATAETAPLQRFFAHEFTHTLESDNAYSGYSDFVVNSAAFAEFIKNGTKADSFEAYKESRRQAEQRINGRTLSDAELTSEAVANFMMSDYGPFGKNGEQVFNSIVSRMDAPAKKGFTETVKNFLRRMIERLKGNRIEAEFIKMRDMWDGMVARMQETANTAEKNAAREDGGKYALVDDIEEKIDKALAGKEDAYSIQLTETTPEILVENGVKNLPMVMNAEHIRKNIFSEEQSQSLGFNEEGNYHELGKSLFLSVLANLDNIDAAYRGTAISKTGQSETFYLLISQFKDKSGDQIIIPVYLNKDKQVNRVWIQTNQIASVYGKENFNNYINRMVNENKLTPIKRKTPKSEVSNQPISWRYNLGASNNSIHNTEANVNSNPNNSSGTGKNALATDLDNIVDSDSGAEQKRSKAEITANREIEELVRRYDGGEIGREELSDGIKGALSVMNAGAKTEIGEKLKKAEKRIARQNEQLIEQRRTARQNAEQKVSDANKRERIRRRVRKIETALRTNTDKKHIPESLKGFAAQVCRTFADNDKATFHGDQLAHLKNMYEAMGDVKDKDGNITQSGVLGWDENILSDLRELTRTAQDDTGLVKLIIDGKTLPQLSSEELQMVEDITANFTHIIENTGKRIVSGRSENLAALSSEWIGQLKSKKEMSKLEEAVSNAVITNNLKPIYYFKRLGKVGERLFGDILNAQSDCMRNWESAQTFIDEAKKKYNYNEWVNKNPIKIKTSHGEELTLTAEQAMQLYASFERQKRHYGSAEHITIGGVVFTDEVGKQEHKAHQLAYSDILEVCNKLEPEQKGYADSIVKYMSETIGGLCNKVTMEMYGYKRFGESYYFPFITPNDYIRTDPGKKQGSPRMKHSSFTKSLVPKASTPIVLQGFSDIAGRHIIDACRYSALTVPVENLMYIYNYRTAGAEGNVSAGVKPLVGDRFGDKAQRYMERFLEDINGNVRPSADTGLEKLISRFKKNAVVASLSVAIQQPSAIGRAFAYVDPKYFFVTGGKKYRGATYEQLKKYAPVAALKEMGRFDTSTGIQTIDWLLNKGEHGRELQAQSKLKSFFTDGEYRADVFGWLPGKMDEVTWTKMWKMILAETEAKNSNLKFGTEEFYKAAGKRFSEIIELTQVYDSTITRSGNMRSSDKLMTVVTSFMAEPTVTANMLIDAADQIKSGNRKFAARAVTSVLFATALNALLKSVVTAARNDDEDKTYTEKYIAEFVSNLVTDTNPMGYFPVLRDIYSIMQGYTVDRSDLSPIADIINGYYSALKFIQSDEEKGAKEYFDVLAEVAGPIANLFDIPIQNVYRDGRAIYNTVSGFLDKNIHTTETGIKKALKEGASAGIVNTLTRGALFSDDWQDAYAAAVKGDKAEYKKQYDYLVKRKGKTDSAIRQKLTEIALDENGKVKKQADEYADKTAEVLEEQKIEKEDIEDAEKAAQNYTAQKFISEKTGLEMTAANQKAAEMESKGISPDVWFTARVLMSRKYADSDGSGSVTKAEKEEALKNAGIDDYYIKIILETKKQDKKN